MIELIKLAMEVLGGGTSLFGDNERKALGFAVVAHNLANATKRGRPIFGSGVVRDLNAFDNGGGMIKLILLFMGLFASGKLDGLFNTLKGGAKEITAAKDDDTVTVEVVEGMLHGLKDDIMAEIKTILPTK